MRDIEALEVHPDGTKFWVDLTYHQALLGRQFDRVLLYRPARTRREAEWLQHLRTKMGPDRKFEWRIPGWEVR